MDRLSTNRMIFREMLRWFACVGFVMLLQILFALAMSVLGPLGILDRIAEFLYAGAVARLGQILCDNPSIGNAPLGLGLFFLMSLFYSAIAGTVLYLFSRYLSREN